jgi:predicted nucleic acid-binding protein
MLFVSRLSLDVMLCHTTHLHTKLVDANVTRAKGVATQWVAARAAILSRKSSCQNCEGDTLIQSQYMYTRIIKHTHTHTHIHTRQNIYTCVYIYSTYTHLAVQSAVGSESSFPSWRRFRCLRWAWVTKTLHHAALFQVSLASRLSVG